MEHHDILIVGGGNAGISLAAKLLRDGARGVAIVEGRDLHRYRPLLNYVGAGVASMPSLERPMSAVVPQGCTWLRDSVVSVDPAAATVTTRGGDTIGWTSLVLCPGLQEDWDAVPGLREAYAAGWAGSTFVPSSTPDVWPALRAVRGGTVVFTIPPEPAPCGATALKPLLMACDFWRRAGVLDALAVRLVTPHQGVVGLPGPDATLLETLTSYGVRVTEEARVTGVDAASRAVTVASPAGTEVITDVASAHVVPEYRAPEWIAESGLAGASPSGLVDVNPRTLQHSRHTSIWALGDAADVATRPSGGALRPQVGILAHNLLAARRNSEPRYYDGYTVMPITTSRSELMLVEVDRDGRPKPTTSLVDLTKPRRATWLVDRYALPQAYFRRILRGKV